MKLPSFKQHENILLKKRAGWKKEEKKTRYNPCETMSLIHSLIKDTFQSLEHTHTHTYTQITK